MQRFSTHRFVKMTLEFWTAFAVVSVVLVGAILIFRYMKGFYPGSRLIIEPTPISANGLEPSQARFMMFYSSWCPWSQKAQRPWRSFKQQLKNTPRTYGGFKVRMEEINAEVEKGKSALYKISAYPTFKLETNEKVITFQGVPDPLNFDAFLTAALGTNSSSSA